MILTDEEKLRIAANPICCPCSPWWLKDDVVLGDVQQAAIVFASEVEREVLRKLREGGPACWTLRETLEAKATTTTGYLWFTDPKNSAWVGLFTIPEDQQ